MESLFKAALRTGEAKKVKMNEVDRIKFSHKACIGTDDLGGCYVIIVCSHVATILGHVSPRHPNFHSVDGEYHISL
jgi:hypothetical protein